MFSHCFYMHFGRIVSPHCLVSKICPQRKAGRKKRARPRSIAIRHQSLAFRTRLFAKYEVPEEEAAPFTFHFALSPLENLFIG